MKVITRVPNLLVRRVARAWVSCAVIGTGIGLMSVAFELPAADCSVTSVGFTPINDLGTGLYLGQFEGGLYPGGANVRPAAHDAAGLALAQGIEPLDAAGNPDPGGSYVLLSIGMSNTTAEFEEFKIIADADPDKDPRLTIVDGAQNAWTADLIVDPNAQFWSTINSRLAAAGVTPEQVAVAWIKAADVAGAPAAEYRDQLQAELEEIARILLNKFSNIRLAYYTSRIYAGYAIIDLNPEPYAYETGFSAKWAIEQQLNGDPTLNFDPGQGAVNAPWMAWGPYLWADGLIPRSDGLIWECDDLDFDGTHPSGQGIVKVANLLLTFFKTDTTAREWFLAQPGMADTVPPAAPTNLVAQ